MRQRVDARVGIVAIGRNEGARLRDCLESVAPLGLPLLYVDSGSTDGSIDLARSLGVTVHELDGSSPFSAARARNEGFDRLLASYPGLELVQFLDGDCALAPGWLERGIATLDGRPGTVIACGRITERHPDASVYNRMCDLEWETPEGEVDASGGNFLVRVAAFRAVGGFRPDVIAAEDDELCLRIRARGGTIFHVAVPMVIHDVALLRFSQWWRRARRTGHAYAQGAALHGRGDERHFVRDSQRLWAWGFVLPVGSVGLAPLTGGASLLLLLAYPLQVARMTIRGRRRGWSARDAGTYGALAMVAKFPGWLGLAEYHWRRARRAPMSIIEHKENRESP